MAYGKISQTFSGEVDWKFSGAYFKLLTAASPVNIQLWRGGAVIFSALQVSGGFYQRIDFDKISITSAGSQLVEFTYGPDEGGTAGSVAVTTNAAPLNLAVADNADSQAPIGAAGILPVLARLELSDGINWQRVRTAAGLSDGNTLLQGLATALWGLNSGNQFDRIRADNEGGGAGALRVTPFGDAITNSASSFSGLLIVGAVAAQYSGLQVVNPSGSGVSLYLDEVFWWGSGTANVYLRPINTAPTGSNVGGGTTKNGLTASKAQFWTYSDAAPGSWSSSYTGLTLPAALQQRQQIKPAIRIPAGSLLLCKWDAVNVGGTLGFQWREY